MDGKEVAFARVMPEHFRAVWTARMIFPLKMFLGMLTAEAGAALPADLSEAEMLARYPALAAAATVLLTLGLACDVWLVVRWLRRRNATVAVEPLARVPAQPWGLRDLTVVAATILLVLLTGGTLILLVARLAHLDDDRTQFVVMLGELLWRIIVLAGLAVYFQTRRVDWQHAFGLRGPMRIGALVQGVILYLAILAPLFGIELAYAGFCKLIHIEPSQQPVADLFLTTDSISMVAVITGFAAIVAPVFEEVMFRGLAYPALKQRWGIWPAMLVISVVFALMHLHVPSMLPLFALSVGLACAYELTGSLLTPITMHALFNIGTVAMLLYIRAHS